MKELHEKIQALLSAIDMDLFTLERELSNINDWGILDDIRTELSDIQEISETLLEFATNAVV